VAARRRLAYVLAMRTRELIVALGFLLGCSHKAAAPAESAHAASASTAIGTKAPDGQLTQASGVKLAMADALHAHTRLDGIVQRGPDGVTRPLWGRPAPVDLVVEEHGLLFRADLAAGQKTGLYFDQRENRRFLAPWCAGRRVLDAFCYAGGFSVHALAGGAASVLAVDASAEALTLTRANLELNGLDAGRYELAHGNVFELLRGLRDRGRSFDLIVLDPPKFAATASQRQGAARGYKDINLLAFKLLAPGGLLATFSCSGAVGGELFQSIVAGAALDAGVEAQVVERLGQAPDHPVLLSFPEAEYLKGLVCRVP